MSHSTEQEGFWLRRLVQIWVSIWLKVWSTHLSQGPAPLFQREGLGLQRGNNLLRATEPCPRSSGRWG
jgi:hypothetical protein